MYKPISLSLYALAMLAMTAMNSGCEKQGNAVGPSQPTTPVATTAKRYLALGDSYTIGQGVPVEDRFPHQVVFSLRSQGVSIGDPLYIATTGWTTANLQAAIAGQSALGKFDVVTLLIGVNDQYQGVDTALYRTRFAQLLEKAVEFAGSVKERVFVLLIPDYSATPFVPASSKPLVKAEIDWFKAINKEVTLQNGIAYSDITPQTRLAANDPGLLASDGLHYSGKENKIWADLIVPKIKAILK